jgi:predicted phosphodiesterase
VRIAALNDIHGNLPALEAVLREVPEDATILCGGDIASGPMPRETLELLRSLGPRVRFIRGNADYEEGEGVGGELWERRRRWVFREQLAEEARAFLESLPATDVLDVDGLGPTLFCHGSPRDEGEIITAVTSEERLREILDGVDERTVVCGHTHHQFDRTVDGIRVVNAGSVGMGYEGRPGAYWALLGPDVDLRRTDYDVEAAVRLFRASGYPEPDDELIPLILEPPPAVEVAPFFERQALEGSP